MIIELDKTGNARLKDPTDVKKFHIEAHCQAGDRAFLARALPPFAEPESDDHAWVFVEALKAWQGQADDPAYRAALAKLTEAAKKYGWYNEDKAAIKAHIEFVGS